MSERRIPLAEPHLAGNERAYLEECVRTNYVSSVGPFVRRFEREFASFVGAVDAVACASGTAALHTALHAIGVGPGDEVLVPTLTFIASANAISYLGARATFVDSEATTWNLDPGLVLEEIERRATAGEQMPKAIEVVHLLGHPADVEPLLDVCAKHGITLVEDAAEALGARYRSGVADGRQAGTVTRVGCFSFNGNKVMTTGGGGMLVTNDEDLARRARHLTTQARLPGRAYDHDEVGYNYRLSNLAAAVGLAQLEQLPGFLDAKRAIAARYEDGFRNLPEISPAPHASWAEPSWWLYSIRLPDELTAERVLERLNEDGIEARPVWTPLHTMAPYRASPLLGDGSTASCIASTAVSLPSSVGLAAADQSRVVDAVIRAVEAG